MGHPGENEFAAGVEFGLYKTAEKGGGRSAVETMIVIQDSHTHEETDHENLLVSRKKDPARKWTVVCPYSGILVAERRVLAVHL